jgi:hypothetical protein
LGASSRPSGRPQAPAGVPPPHVGRGTRHSRANLIAGFLFRTRLGGFGLSGETGFKKSPHDLRASFAQALGVLVNARSERFRQTNSERRVASSGRTTAPSLFWCHRY